MFDNELYGGNQPKAWTKMVKYVQTRFSDDQSVKSLYAQKKLKEDIFKTIYESFQKGHKLQRFDVYAREHAARIYLDEINKMNQRDPGSQRQDAKKALAEKKRKQQQEMDNAAKKKEEQQNKMASYLQVKEKDIERQKKIFQLQSVKEAINNRTMSIKDGNDILLKNVKTENNKMLRRVTGKKSRELRRFMNFISQNSMELDKEMMDYINAEKQRPKSSMNLGGRKASPDGVENKYDKYLKSPKRADGPKIHIISHQNSKKRSISNRKKNKTP